VIDRDLLLKDLQKVTSDLTEDLRERTDGVAEVRDLVRGLYREAREAGRTDRTYAEWREDLLAQVVVGWVLATVFVRFCEDNGLYRTPLLSGPGERYHLARDHRADWLAQNPAAGDREWLAEVFRRYQAIPATAELFGPRNPLWQFGPSVDGARRLLDLWWKHEQETGELRHDFSDQELDTRFLGDLYQDLSKHAKEVYALLQTPVFVEEFILTHTLEPAIRTFGLAAVKMIDPTCGSGHFLLGGFHRILAHWQEREASTPMRELVQRTLDAVCGVDLNPFAAEIARFRLLVAALHACRITDLHDAPAFRINIAVGDSLIHGRRGGQLFTAAEDLGPVLRHRYPMEDEERANRLLESGRYHAVVGNPPYINVADPAMNRAYRALYETCYRQYSLGVPFTERFFDLAASPGRDGGGYIGMITTNSFMKREFGKLLVEEFLPRLDLTHIIDTSGAYIPGHGTPTVILFGRHQRPTSDSIRAVLGIRGEPGQPSDPAHGKVWTSIVELIDQTGAENEFVSVEDALRERYARHPWSLQGGAASEVKAAIDSAARKELVSVARLIGYTGQTNADPVFLGPDHALRRRGAEEDVQRPLVIGEMIRDWRIERGESVLFPYDVEHATLIDIADRPGLHRTIWPWRTVMGNRRTFSKKSYFEEGRPWWEWHQVALDRVQGFAIFFAFVATHNHFVLDRGGKVSKQSALMIKLSDDVGEDDYVRLVGLLNSSAACFWMKQVFHNKGDSTDSAGARVTGVDAWVDSYEHDGTKLKQFPLPESAPLNRSRRMDELAHLLTESLPETILNEKQPSRDQLTKAKECVETVRSQMVALQEELDWECYRHFGLIDEELTVPSNQVPNLSKGERAFEIALARRIAARQVESTWFDRHNSTAITELPEQWTDDYKQVVERRLELIKSDRAIRLLERPEYKRRWNWDAWEDLQREALRSWLQGFQGGLDKHCK
jgi:hypothetical protein